MTIARQNWLDSTSWQIEFYQASVARERKDPEFAWAWMDGYENHKRRYGDAARELVKRTIRRMPIRTRWHDTPYGLDWLRSNHERLWSARCLLEDDLSKILFDAHLVLRATSHRQFYFPRIEFDDLLTLRSERAFESGDLPRDYLGLPLRVFDLSMPGRPDVPQLNVVSTRLQIDLLNSYRQYLVRRGNVDFAPSNGEVVMDCGACIGEVSMVFAGLVGGQGEVHLFDPVPLHSRYCELQGRMNPSLASALRINVMAVGDVSREASGAQSNSDRIAPGGLVIDSFKITTLDDYIEAQKLTRVDFIKMDIEGAEMAALDGGAKLIGNFKPRLAISAYHKPEDLWELPHRMKQLNPAYRLFFGHHSPTQLESVYYAA